MPELETNEVDPVRDRIRCLTPSCQQFFDGYVTVEVKGQRHRIPFLRCPDCVERSASLRRAIRERLPTCETEGNGAP